MSERNAQSEDPFLAELARGTQICFAGCPHASHSERQSTLLQVVASPGRILAIAIPSTGLILLLNVNFLDGYGSSKDSKNDSSPAIFGNGSNRNHKKEVHFESRFFFNGLPTKITGYLDVNNLTGMARAQHDQYQTSTFGDNNDTARYNLAMSEAFKRRLNDFRNAISR